jgi:hypothetical protein
LRAYRFRSETPRGQRALAGLLEVAPQVGLDVQDDAVAPARAAQGERRVGPVRAHQLGVAQVADVLLILAPAA